MTPAQRQAAVLGDGPRVPPLDVTALTGDLAELLAGMIAINTAIGSRESAMLTDIVTDAAAAGGDAADVGAQVAALPEIMRTMLRHPALFRCLTQTGRMLLGDGALPARDRELAILRTAWLCHAPYEWGEHVLIAHKAGITPAETEAVTLGSAAPGWSAHDRAILRAVEELKADAKIADATWAMLADRYDDRQLIELPALIGQYQAVAYYQNSLQLRLHHDNPGLAAR